MRDNQAAYRFESRSSRQVASFVAPLSGQLQRAGLTTMGTYVRIAQVQLHRHRHDSDRPWIVVDTSHRSVTLPDGESFFAWAHENWPAPRWTVQLDPWELSPDGRRGFAG